MRGHGRRVMLLGCMQRRKDEYPMSNDQYPIMKYKIMRDIQKKFDLNNHLLRRHPITWKLDISSWLLDIHFLPHQDSIGKTINYDPN